MNHHHIAGLQGFADGRFLSSVEPGKAQRHASSGGKLRTEGAVEDVAQMGKAALFGIHHAVEGFKHEAVGGLVEIELHARTLQRENLRELALVVEADHHARCFGIAHSGREGQVMQRARCILREENNGLSVFKVVLNVGVFASRDFHHQAVERIIIAAPGCDWKPAVAALHFSPDAHQFRRFLKGGLFGFIFLAQEFALAQERGCF